MIEAYRYACGRCGSQAISPQTHSDHWRCQGCQRRTPAVFDLANRRWEHIGEPRQAPIDA